MRGAVVEVEEAAVVREGAVAAEACRGPRAVARDRQAPLGCRNLREEEAYRVHPVEAAVSRGLHNFRPAVPRGPAVGACPRLHQSGLRAVNAHPAERAPRSFHRAIVTAQRIDLPSLRGAALRHVPQVAWPTAHRKSRRVLALRIGLRRVLEAAGLSGRRKSRRVLAQQIGPRAARPVVPRSFPPNLAPALPNALAGNPASDPARAT
jgi:hypothetical protein